MKTLWAGRFFLLSFIVAEWGCRRDVADGLFCLRLASAGNPAYACKCLFPADVITQKKAAGAIWLVSSRLPLMGAIFGGENDRFFRFFQCVSYLQVVTARSVPAKSCSPCLSDRSFLPVFDSVPAQRKQTESFDEIGIFLSVGKSCRPLAERISLRLSFFFLSPILTVPDISGLCSVKSAGYAFFPPFWTAARERGCFCVVALPHLLHRFANFFSMVSSQNLPLLFSVRNDGDLIAVLKIFRALLRYSVTVPGTPVAPFSFLPFWYEFLPKSCPFALAGFSSLVRLSVAKLFPIPFAGLTGCLSRGSIAGF